MTLCLAWVEKGLVNFASDSRSGNDDGYKDTTVKVSSVRVKIDTPVDNGVTETVYDHSLAICYSGMVSDSTSIKEHVTEAMQNLQFVPGIVEISLENICEFFGRYFKTVATDTKIGYDLDPDITFLVAGFCPLLDIVAVYQLSLFPDALGGFEMALDRVMEDEEEIIAIGSGSVRTEQKLNEIIVPRTINILKLLRETCRDEEDDVGGYIQYGKFNGKDFSIYGVQDYEIDEDEQLEIVYTYRGIPVYNGDFQIDETKLQMRMNYICPFQKEINDYLKNQ